MNGFPEQIELLQFASTNSTSFLIAPIVSLQQLGILSPHFASYVVCGQKAVTGRHLGMHREVGRAFCLILRCVLVVYSMVCILYFFR